MSKNKETSKEVNKQVNTDIKLAYKSKVKVEFVNKHGKVVKSLTTHNNIGNQLKLFLFRCLAGEYDNQLRPLYGVPFKVEDNSYKSIIKKGDQIPINDANINVSSAPSIAPSISYKLYIPNSLIFGKQFNGVALYNSNKVDDVDTGVTLTNYSMAFEMNNSTTAVNYDYSLIISWTISIEDLGQLQ